MSLTYISPIVSVIALSISLFTLWYSILRRGTIHSTNPLFVAILYDFAKEKNPNAKIFLRTLLYSTSKRGQVIESLSLRVREGKRLTEFSFWGYGDKDLVRGSGIFVPDTGVATNHHFNPINLDMPFLFSGGTYSLELVAKRVGQKSLISLWSITLQVPAEPFANGPKEEAAIFYNWSLEQKRYVASIETSNQRHLVRS